MRKLLTAHLPDTKSLKDPATLEYAKALNVELDNLRRDLNKYVSKIVVSSLTADATLNAQDELVLCNGTFTVTLPPASGSEGKIYYIKNIGSGTVTIDGNSSETIDNATTKDLFQLEYVQIVSDNTEWWIV